MIRDFLISFCASFPALLVALWVERLRQPRLKITIGKFANISNPNISNGDTFRTFRVNVKNVPFSLLFSWIPRYSAQNCTAEIAFTGIGSDKNSFIMRGRWANTPEPAYIPPDQVFNKTLFPDPVTISQGESELLDIFTKPQNDVDAYGWNNDSYLSMWKTPKFKLRHGRDYLIKVTVRTQNGVKFSKDFQCRIGDRIDNTTLS